MATRYGSLINTCVRQTQTWNNLPTLIDEYIVGNHGTIKDVSSVSTPNFRSRQKRGEIIINPFSSYTWSRSFSPGSMVNDPVQPDEYKAVLVGDFAATVESNFVIAYPIADQLVAMDNAVLVQAYARIRDTKVMTGEILNDAASTLSMLRHPFSGLTDVLARCAKSAKRSWGKTSASVAKANASAWLEYRYGWKPLLLDCKQIVKNATTARQRMRREVLVCRASKSASGQSLSTITDKPSFRGWLASGTAVVSQEATSSAGVIYAHNYGSVADMIAEDLSLDSSALASTMWELVPYSFVADWFFNIGDWISAHNVPPSVQVLGNWVTRKNKVSITYSSSSFKATGFTGSPSTWGGSCLSSDEVHRSANVELPSAPQLVPKKSSAATHAIDAVALLVDPIIGSIKKLRH